MMSNYDKKKIAIVEKSSEDIGDPGRSLPVRLYHIYVCEYADENGSRF